MMENQIAHVAQQVSQLSRPQRHLPSQPETNREGQMNAITLRSGEELECPQILIKKDKREIDSGDDAKKEVPIEALCERVQAEKTKEVQVKHVNLQ